MRWLPPWPGTVCGARRFVIVLGASSNRGGATTDTDIRFKLRSDQLRHLRPERNEFSPNSLIFLDMAGLSPRFVHAHLERFIAISLRRPARGLGPCEAPHIPIGEARAGSVGARELGMPSPANLRHLFNRVVTAGISILRRVTKGKKGIASIATFCQPTRYHLRLHLRRPLKDVEYARVTQYPADFVFERVAVPTVNLQARVGVRPSDACPQ